uniref:Uncharacterized protein n=1 Tax=Arundo donax TaxID=35708 RepID=A0A0A8ZFE7_ARUDO
MVRGRGQYS